MEAKPSKRVIDMLDDALLCVIGGQGAFLCCGKLLLGQQFFDFSILAFSSEPSRCQGIRKTAQANEFRKGGLLLCRCHTVLRL